VKVFPYSSSRKRSQRPAAPAKNPGWAAFRQPPREPQLVLRRSVAQSSVCSRVERPQPAGRRIELAAGPCDRGSSCGAERLRNQASSARIFRCRLTVDCGSCSTSHSSATPARARSRSRRSRRRVAIGQGLHPAEVLRQAGDDDGGRRRSEPITKSDERIDGTAGLSRSDLRPAAVALPGRALLEWAAMGGWALDLGTTNTGDRPLGRRASASRAGRAPCDLPEPLGPGAARSAAAGAVRRRPGRPPEPCVDRIGRWPPLERLAFVGPRALIGRPAPRSQLRRWHTRRSFPPSSPPSGQKRSAAGARRAAARDRSRSRARVPSRALAEVKGADGPPARDHRRHVARDRLRGATAPKSRRSCGGSACTASFRRRGRWRPPSDTG
jgi:hypothetical protein